MRVFGLTGGIASGKSEAARRLRELGVPVIDADKVGHGVIEPGGAAESAVTTAFGPAILTNGRIDRSKLGAIVFAEPAQLERLNAIVHPLIKAQITRECQALAAAGHPLAVIDAALLGEGGKIADTVDAIALVLADKHVRVKRLMQYRGLTEAEAIARVEAQTPPETKIPLAKWILENNGSLEAFLALVDNVARRMLLEATRRP